MKLHDGNCKEFDIEHTPGLESNPVIWGISRNDILTVPMNHPVTGWRFARAVYAGNTLLQLGVFDPDNPSPWGRTVAAPQATCDPNQLRQRAMVDVTRRALTHGTAPDPGCECGYRIVRSTTEMNKYMRWSRTRLADIPPNVVPEHVRERVGDVPVHQSFVVVSVLGCGDTASCESDLWTDPDGTVRVEWLAATENIIASEGDPVVGALREWGSTVTVVPNVNDVHEVDECAERDSALELWRMSDPAPVEGVVLVHEDRPQVFEHYTANRRYGLFGGAGVAVVRDGMVLLVQSAQHWLLPGGARLEGEPVGACVVRETFEETGVDLTGVPVRFAFARSDAAGWSYTTVVVDAPESVAPVVQAEVSDWGWFADPPVGTHPDLLATWERIIAP